MLCFQSMSMLFPPYLASNAAPFLQGKGTVLYFCLLWFLKHSTYLAVHIHHEPGPSASCTSYPWLQTTLQRKVIVRKNTDHSLKVEQFLSCQGTWFSLNTNDVVRAQSSKCPLKQPHNTQCLTLNVNSSDLNVTGIASLHWFQFVNSDWFYISLSINLLNFAPRETKVVL